MLSPVPTSALDAAQCDREASDSKGWALARLHAVEREVARLMETDFEPEVLYPGLALPAEQSDNMPIVATSAVRQRLRRRSDSTHSYAGSEPRKPRSKSTGAESEESPPHGQEDGPRMAGAERRQLKEKDE